MHKSKILLFLSVKYLKSQEIFCTAMASILIIIFPYINDLYKVNAYMQAFSLREFQPLAVSSKV